MGALRVRVEHRSRPAGSWSLVVDLGTDDGPALFY